jgi:DNA processing protein
LEELGMGEKGVVPLFDQNRAERPAVAASDDPILACLSAGEPSDLDAIADRTGLATSRLLPRLLALELRGAIARLGGGRFVRIDRTC